ncbi:MAG: hypothetical protein RLO01_20215 [Thalassobaculaceae bacterium]
MNRRHGQRRPFLTGKRRYGWRDIAAVLGLYALVLQIGLGIVAGFAGESIARESRADGGSIADLAQQICSPGGLVRLATVDDSEPEERRGIPVCPGCLVGHAAPIPPTAAIETLPIPVRGASSLPTAGGERPAPLDLLSALNPRAPPAPV